MNEQHLFSCWCYALHSIHPTEDISIQMFARSFYGSRGFPVIYINILFFYVHTYSLKLDQYTTDGKVQSIPDKKMNIK